MAMNKFPFYIGLGSRKFKVNDVIGSGSYGRVLDAFDKDTGLEVAVKEIDIRVEEFRKSADSELKALTKLKNARYSITLLHTHETQTHLYLILEKGECSLRQLLNNQSLTTKTIIMYFKCLVNAIAELHTLGIIHCDVKPENAVLINGQLKLIDFGSSFFINMRKPIVYAKTVIGTVEYMSPELAGHVVEKEVASISPKTDIWSVGIIFYEMLFGKRPFQTINDIDSKLRAICDVKISIDFPAHVDEKAKQILNGCLQKDIHKRMDVYALRLLI